MTSQEDIIVAPATAPGGALQLIRMSGVGSIALCDRFFHGRTRLVEAASHTLHYGTIEHEGEVIDEVVVSLFRAPHSYTGEESVELSCHGSRYVARRLLALLTEAGARFATAGEFSIRAYLNGRLDLSQAEAVADLIASESRAAHEMAMNQMRGHYSGELKHLHDRLLELCALLELELDFSEEEVEFADRATVENHLALIKEQIARLLASFRLGHVLREGVAVAIVGEPNAGKSTLLNRLVGDERALVSEIAGTTRDTIEERIQLDGVLFRLIDTAGLHASSDRLENLGMERTRKVLQEAHVVLHLVDVTQGNSDPIVCREGQTYLRVYNKIDRMSEGGVSMRNGASEQVAGEANSPAEHPIWISARTGEGIDALRQALRQVVDTGSLDRGDTVVSTARHADALQQALSALHRAQEALRLNLPSDLLAEDLRQVAHHLGSITGSISSDDILQSIFSKFCIGK